MQYQEMLQSRYFNPIKVRLKQIPDIVLYHILLFQFHKGTLKTQHSLSVLAVVLNFNSIKVRLKLPIHRGFAGDFANFNSIKVRLKLDYPAELVVLALHFNSIKVRLKLAAKSILAHRLAFQFHKGTIKTCCCCYVEFSSFNFNSIKVRLKHAAAAMSSSQASISIP